MISQQYVLYQGDSREILKTLPNCSVHTCITSPPYFGLRDYGVDGQIGLEQTPDEYVRSMVELFREVRRVLRDDGTLWLNLGDSYAAQRSGTAMPAETLSGGIGGKGEEDAHRGHGSTHPHRNASAIGLKHKDLIGIPWRVALALQADGWYLRQDIIWHKPNPMPESVTDRCTKAHEYIFMLSKSPRYYFDSEAIKEKSVTDGTRNKRSVWTVTTKPFRGAHFATFPEDLILPCVQAGTSKHGCCSKCGAPYERNSERSRATFSRGKDPSMFTGRAGMNRPRAGLSERYVLGITQSELAKRLRDAANGRQEEMRELFGSKWDHWTRTDKEGARVPIYEDAQELEKLLGVKIPFDGNSNEWIPTCACEVASTVPCTVLDPFNGAATTGVVALKEGRRYIGIELNPDYIKLSEERIKKHFAQSSFGFFA